MNGDLVVFGGLVISGLIAYAIAAEIWRDTKRTRNEQVSNERCRREFINIRNQRPEHIVQVSRDLMEQHDAS